MKQAPVHQPMLNSYPSSIGAHHPSTPGADSGGGAPGAPPPLKKRKKKRERERERQRERE